MRTKIRKRTARKKYTLNSDEVRRLWQSQIPTKELAEQLGVSLKILHHYAKKIGLTRRKHVKPQPPATMIDPTPQEIAERAAEVRAMRSEIDNERTNQYRQTRVEIKQYIYNVRQSTFSEI